MNGHNSCPLQKYRAPDFKAKLFDCISTGLMKTKQKIKKYVRKSVTEKKLYFDVVLVISHLR